MTIGEFRSQLLAVIDQATADPSTTQPRYTKNQIWDRLLRQCSMAANEEGVPADSDEINEMYVKTFNREFKL